MRDADSIYAALEERRRHAIHPTTPPSTPNPLPPWRKVPDLDIDLF